MSEGTASTNSTEVCHKHVAPNPPPLFQNGSIHFQTHHIGFIISGTFAIISTVVSAWLISKHLQWYYNKREQRYIVRLLFMVPLYALISFASFFFWNQSTPIVLVRDAYEAIVLTAFFYLLLNYLSDDPEEQKRIFLKRGLSKAADRNAMQRGVPLPKWCFPLGFIKKKPKDGLYFLQMMKWAVLQYCVIRPTTTLAAVVLDYMGLYCESSWGLGWGHIYITIIVSISVSVAMYCLIQLYVVVSEELAPFSPLLKLFSVKAVVFLTFWQATLLGVLSMFGVVKDTTYMTAEDINIGIGALLETVEMMLFAFLHIRAFTYKPYKVLAIKAARGGAPVRTPQWRSLGNAMDFRETFREIWIGCIYLYDKMRGREPKPDFGVRRHAHYEVAFGRSRFQDNTIPRDDTKVDKEEAVGKATLPVVHIEVDRETEVELEGQRQWLGLGKHDRYGVHPRREKSEGLHDSINHELERLGYPKLNKEGTTPLEGVPRAPSSGSRLPWWRNIYNRISQSGSGQDGDGERESFLPRNTSKRLSRQSHLRTETRIPEDINRDIDDHPPRSLLHPSKVHSASPGSPTKYYGVDQDRFSREDRLPMLPLNYVDDGYGRVNNRNDHHNRDDHRFAAWPSSPERSSPRASRSPPPPRQTYNRGIGPIYHDPYDALGPVYPRPHRNQVDRPRANEARNQPRSPPTSYVPSRESLVFPTPLSPQSPPFAASPSQQVNARMANDRPPPTPPKNHRRTSLPEDQSPPYAGPYRDSRDRRGAANPLSGPSSPTSPTRGPQFSSPSPTGIRHPTLQRATSPEDRTHAPQAMYMKQPATNHSRPNDPS